MPSHQDEDDDVESFPEARFLLPQLDGTDTEDVEKYQRGGFHPVHLSDLYDGRYRIVHKLGAGGFSTVWLARDEKEHNWVALKIVVADYSTCVSSKSQFISDVVSQCNISDTVLGFVVEHRQFIIDGPNGRHLCLVLPVLGPSASDLSNGIYSRINPPLSRRASYQATRALANLHEQGLCHGDVTPANILFGLSDFHQYTESDIYHLFGAPETAALETESGEMTGPEAPSYIVRSLNFLSSEKSVIRKDVRLIDFDQSFLISRPPEKMLGTPAEFLAPELAVGFKASSASDVWALGCSIFRMRSGEGPFAGFEVNSPVDLMRMLIRTLGELPSSWKDILFDYDGQPTKDSSKGSPLEPWEGHRSIRDLVYRIWDQPENEVIKTGRIQEEDQARNKDENRPYPRCLWDTVWKPTAVKINDAYLHGYDDDMDELLEAMPKISEHEAALLYDLLSKIFLYDADKRPSAREMLSHPWFHMDDL